MSQNHAKKNAARRTAQKAGASYTSAAAGVVHEHVGPDFPPVDGALFGADRNADMNDAGKLVGAVLAECRDCQRTLTDKVLAGDRLAITALAGSPYAQVATLPAAVVTPTSRRFFEAIDDGPAALALVESLDALELEDLLEDALNAWAGQAAQEEMLAAAEIWAAHASEGQEPEDDDPQLYRGPSSHVVAYLMSAGIHDLLSDDEIAQLIAVGEASALPGGAPLECFLCDQQIDMRSGAVVRLGLSMRTTVVGDREMDLLMPVWTHDRAACGGNPRIWAAGALDDERRARGLPVADGQPAAPPDSGPVEEDYTIFLETTLPGGVHPMLVIAPGKPHPHGVEGHRADLLSFGLKPIDWAGGGEPPQVESWQIRMDKGRMTAITRSGAGEWYRQDGGYATPAPWRKAARAKRAVFLLVLPYGSISLAASGEGYQMPMADLAEKGLLLGGLVPLRGTLS